MSESVQDKMEKIKTSAHAKWTTGSQAVQALDKDVWHNIKKDANIKKTKWYESGSSIGPRITKAQSSCKKFAEDMSLSNYKSAEKSLDELAKECKGFWSKHKEAPQDTVKTTLKIYEAAAEEALKALEGIKASMPVLEKMSQQAATSRGLKGVAGL